MRELPHHRPPAAHWLRAASLWRSLDGHSSELPQAMREVVAAANGAGVVSVGARVLIQAIRGGATMTTAEMVKRTPPM